jgi:16S rRNA (guanine527-N7)-methyltransferase
VSVRAVPLPEQPQDDASLEAGVPVSRETLPAAASVVAGARASLLGSFADLLATEGVTRGLLGPREATKVWERHLLNCAVVAECASPAVDVADIGSGAGLPGLVWAICRPDLNVTLVEPLLRRVTFLQDVSERLELTNTELVRARAEELHGQRTFDVVTSRAVAPLGRLASWCLPLVRPGGSMVAIKGASAGNEIEAAGAAVQRLGGLAPVLMEHGRGLVDPSAWAIHIERSRRSRQVGSGQRSPHRRAPRGRGTA